MLLLLEQQQLLLLEHLHLLQLQLKVLRQLLLLQLLLLLLLLMLLMLMPPVLLLKRLLLLQQRARVRHDSIRGSGGVLDRVGRARGRAHRGARHGGSPSRADGRTARCSDSGRHLQRLYHRSTSRPSKVLAIVASTAAPSRLPALVTLPSPLDCRVFG